MRIKILNKNNNQWYEVDEGSVRTEVKNETLDSGVIVISNQTSTIDIEPFDIVQVQYHDYSPYCACVDTYTETLTSINPKVYKYEIHLFSETKQLENTVLPSLKITTNINAFGEPEPLSVWQYIDRYLSYYCPKVFIRYHDTSVNPPIDTYRAVSMFEWDNLESIFTNVKCPEMQWNTPTLREVLNDLMMVKDCIPVVRNGRIYAMDLTSVNNKNWLDDSHINYVTKSRSSEDYVSELKVNLVNVTNQIKTIDNSTNKTEYLGFTSDDNDVSINTNNAFLKTQYPIYKINSLKMMFVGRYDDVYQGSPITYYYWTEFDLCSIPRLVSEYKEWILKKVDYYQSVPSTLSEFADSQNWSIYFTRGSNRIENFFNKTKVFLWIEKSLLPALQEKIMADKQPGRVAYRPPDEYYQTMFKIEYETLEGSVFTASKGTGTNHRRVVVDNQTNSYVDSYKQGFLEYQKANRLGNEQVQINARFHPDDRIMQIGDMYDDCVIYQCQYQYYRDHIEVNAIATKDYILRDYFTGVKSKLRSWAIAEGSEALTRCDLQKLYCEFSFSRSDKHNYILGTDQSLLTSRANYFLSPLIDYTSKPVEYAFLRASNKPGDYVYDYRRYPAWFNVDLVKRIVGNSIVMTVALPDNTIVGKSIDNDQIPLNYVSNAGVISWADTINLGGIPVKNQQYTDNRGTVSYFYFMFTDDFDPSPVIVENGSVEHFARIEDQQGINPSDSNNERRDYLYFTLLKPLVLENQFYYNVEGYFKDYRVFSSYAYPYYKDSQEIPNFSFQVEFCSDTTDISFSKEWVKRQVMINSKDNDISDYKIIVYESQYYNFRNLDNLPSQGYVNTNNCRIDIGNDYFDIIFLSYGYNSQRSARNAGISYARNRCFYLNDGDETVNKVILAFTNLPLENCIVVQDGSWHFGYRIYLNRLSMRDKHTYDNNNHYLIVDDN